MISPHSVFADLGAELLDLFSSCFSHTFGGYSRYGYIPVYFIFIFTYIRTVIYVRSMYVVKTTLD